MVKPKKKELKTLIKYLSPTKSHTKTPSLPLRISHNVSYSNHQTYTKTHTHIQPTNEKIPLLFLGKKS